MWLIVPLFAYSWFAAALPRVALAVTAPPLDESWLARFLSTPPSVQTLKHNGADVSISTRCVNDNRVAKWTAGYARSRILVNMQALYNLEVARDEFDAAIKQINPRTVLGESYANR
jgi:hypothetical protein